MTAFMRRIFAISIITLIPAVSNAYDLSKQVHEYKLPNGMRWLFVKRAQAPVFSGVVMVRVGGLDEEVGKTGLAHLFEHMAFKGSDKLGTKDYKKEKPILDEIEKVGGELTAEQKKRRPDKARVGELSKKMAGFAREADKYQNKNEIWELMTRNGGSDLNAFTSKDITAYHASMPIDKLRLWAKITAEMVFKPAFREFYTERSVVAEERRSSVDNNPDGAMAEKLLAASFAEGPYHWSTIGYENDVMGLTIEDARAFHNKHYVPANMTGVLVGDINVEEAKKIVNEAFGSYPAAKIPEAPSKAGTQSGGIVKTFKFIASPSLAMAWHKPTLPDKSEYSFDIINSLLCEGSSSRLRKKLMYDKKMVEEIFCSVAYPGSRLDTLFLVWIEPLKSHSPAEVLKEVSVEIEKLKKDPVPADELTRVRKKVTAGMVFSLDKNVVLAKQLAEFQTIFGDWRLFADYPRRIEEVAADDVMETARKYLNDDNRVVLERLGGSR